AYISLPTASPPPDWPTLQRHLQQLQQQPHQQQLHQQQTTVGVVPPENPDPVGQEIVLLEAASSRETAPAPPPEPIGPPSAARIQARGKILRGLPKGNIVLHAPNAMRVGERRTVEANVGVNVETLRKPSSSRDQTIEGSLHVSSEMVALLNGAGFKID